MAWYRNKPVKREAKQWTGDNATEIMLFVGRNLKVSRPPHSMEVDKDNIPNEAYTLIIPTLEGDMTASKGDYIIEGIKGEFYPCKPDIFELTYELVE